MRKKLEKNITLAVGILLKKKIEANGNFDVVLTRNKDVYLKLRERTSIAKKSNADIFISLHADYNKNKRTEGFPSIHYQKMHQIRKLLRWQEKINRIFWEMWTFG